MIATQDLQIRVPNGTKRCFEFRYSGSDLWRSARVNPRRSISCPCCFICNVWVVAATRHRPRTKHSGPSAALAAATCVRWVSWRRPGRRGSAASLKLVRARAAIATDAQESAGGAGSCRHAGARGAGAAGDRRRGRLSRSQPPRGRRMLGQPVGGRESRNRAETAGGQTAG